MDKITNIAFIRSTPYDGRTNIYNDQGVGITKAFCQLGYNCDYIDFKKKNQTTQIIFEHDGFVGRHIQLPRIRFFRTGLNRYLYTKEFIEKYDLIICREYNQLNTFLISRKTDKVVLYSGPYWNMFMIKPMSLLYDKMFTKSIDKNIKYKFTKSVLAKEFLENKGYTNLVNIGVGLDTERFEKDIEIDSNTKVLSQYMKENNCLLYIGKIDENKNYVFLLELYEKLLEGNPDLKFVVIGKSKQSWQKQLMGRKNESYEEECYSKFSKKLREGIYRVNQIDNMQLKYIYPLAKVFVLPSKNEIFGMVMLEAMYFGTPVVTSRNGGSLTLITENKYGQIVDGYNVEDWVNAVNNYLNNNVYSEQVSNNTKLLIRKSYTWKSIATKILKNIGDKENVNL